MSPIAKRNPPGTMRRVIASRSGEPKVESHPIDSPHTMRMIPMINRKAHTDFLVMAISLANVRCCKSTVFVAMDEVDEVEIFSSMGRLWVSNISEIELPPKYQFLSIR